MQTLVVYDHEGYIYEQMSSESIQREPVGLPFILIELPEGKRIKTVDGIGVDVSATPHRVILEDIPPSETQVLNDKIDNAIMELTTLIAMGGM